MNTDTIAAIASGLTRSGIGVIRVSGPDAAAVCDKVFKKSDGSSFSVSLSERPSHTIHYGFIYDGEEKLDEALCMLMWAPRSYTGEDVVEIQCHGGPYVMRRILETILSAGARAAEPGEFSKRAFLNGRMDLTQAEAVMDMISAENESAIKSSIEQISGRLSNKIKGIRASLLEEMAMIEAALDDPEHLSLDGQEKEIRRTVYGVKEEIHALASTFEEGKRRMEGIHTVILGRPNAGKSSLWNCLLGEDRAIVTEVAGTTRDILQESISMGGFSLRLVDTAGIRNTNDPVENIGVEKAREQARKADLIFYVVDSSEPLDENDREILKLLSGKNCLVILNKTDLPECLTQKEVSDWSGLPVYSVSAVEGTGMEAVRQAVIRLFEKEDMSYSEQVVITHIRHKEALFEAEKALEMVLDSIDGGMPEDFWTIDMMHAYAQLGNIIGEEVGDDLVAEIFSRFCMGK